MVFLLGDGNDGPRATRCSHDAVEDRMIAGKRARQNVIRSTTSSGKRCRVIVIVRGKTFGAKRDRGNTPTHDGNETKGPTKGPLCFDIIVANILDETHHNRSVS